MAAVVVGDWATVVVGAGSVVVVGGGGWVGGGDVVVGAGVGYAVGKLVAHFSPFRGQQDMSLTPWGLPGGGGLQLGFNF